MKTTITFCLLMLLPFLACNKKQNNLEAQITEGIYVGTFQRENMQIVPVSLEFSVANWTGTSDFQKYPALCNGTYSQNVNQQIIIFRNSCIWTAEFDWTLILKDTFHLSIINDSIVMKKTYPNNSWDEYRLKKM